MTYFTTTENWIYDDVSGKRFPATTENPDYNVYLAWVAAGNTPGNIILSQREDYVKAVQDHMDARAKLAGYYDILSASTYAGAPGPFQAEGIAFLNWRSACWEHCYQVLDDVQNAIRPQPTTAQLIAELPAYTPPV
jgi:hypothetical protein